MLTYELKLKFTSPYIGSPYWLEMHEYIEITKKSGMNRAKSEANRRKALEEYLRMSGMSLGDFKKLEAESVRPFHALESGEIIIPTDRFLAFLVETNDKARAAFKACPPEQVRSKIMSRDFTTGKFKEDGIWRRFIVPTAGTGAKASNQRRMNSDPYIENFTAVGQVLFDEQTVNPEALQNAVMWGGQFVGIGASRRMEKGRFDLIAFDPVK